MTARAHVLNLPELIETVQSLKAQGKKVVTTNGCFDVLHVGHLRYLEAARALGDVLVVLVNSDASVRCLEKGPGRPVNHQDERAEMLAGLACVDYTCLFDEASPAGVLATLKPDIHAKGGDYTADNLPEASALKSVGAELAFIPLVEGRSTTSVIQRILAAYQPA